MKPLIPSILEYLKTNEKPEIKKIFAESLRQTMIMTMLIDGKMDTEEENLVCAIYEKMLDGYHDEENTKSILKEIDSVSKWSEDYFENLKTAKDKLGKAGLELIIKAALFVAVSDSDFAESELNFILAVGETLGYPPAKVVELIEQMGSEGLTQAA